MKGAPKLFTDSQVKTIVCTTQNVGRQQSILQHVTLMLFVYQVCHSIGQCQKWELFFMKYGVKVNGQYY